MSDQSFEASLGAVYAPATVVAYGINLVGALPAYVWLSRRSALTAARLLGVGAALGAAPFVALGLDPVLRHPMDFAVWLAMGVGSGVLAAAVFSLIVLPGLANPNAS